MIYFCTIYREAKLQYRPALQKSHLVDSSALRSPSKESPATLKVSSVASSTTNKLCYTFQRYLLQASLSRTCNNIHTVLIFVKKCIIKNIQRVSSALDVFFLSAVKKVTPKLATGWLWSTVFKYKKNDIYIYKNSQAVKKGCVPKKSRVKKNVKSKVVDKK